MLLPCGPRWASAVTRFPSANHQTMVPTSSEADLANGLGGSARAGRRPTIRRVATTEQPRETTGTEKWREQSYAAVPEREGELFSTMSGVENEPLYTPDSVVVDY